MVALEEKVSTDIHYCIKARTRTKLLLAVEPEVANNNDYLTYHGYPEWCGSHRRALEAVLEVPLGGIGEDALGSDLVGCCCASDHDTDGTDDLREGESGTHVQTREGLEDTVSTTR